MDILCKLAKIFMTVVDNLGRIADLLREIESGLNLILWIFKGERYALGRMLGTFKARAV